ncbi:MAG TPA: RidA family protein [Candidatus Elarobacter sp.]|jgi:enamine deaminase RidA (YjgF/YER057c/UK114 family)
MTILQPRGWPRPKGYACGVAAEGRQIFVSGQIGWDESGRFTARDIAGQVRQALLNVIAVLNEAGGAPSDVVRLTWYVVDKREYLGAQREIGAAYRDVMGAHYPAMSVVQVASLLEDDAKVEIEATAVVLAASQRGKDGSMDDDRSSERTETDERVAENQSPAPIATWDDQNPDPATGLPRGMHDDDASPVDRGEPLDPFGGKAPSERVDALKPGPAQDQAFGSVNETPER